MERQREREGERPRERSRERSRESRIERRSEAVSRLLLATTVLTASIDIAATVLVWRNLDITDAVPSVVSAAAGVVYTTLGTLVVRRTRNVVGWVLTAIGTLFPVCAIVSIYAVAGTLWRPRSLPAARTVGAFAETVFVAIALGLGLLAFVFPTGRLTSRRWRWVCATYVVAGVLTIVGLTLAPAAEHLPAPGGISLVYPNPLRVDAPLVSTGVVVVVWITVLTLLAGVASLVVRYRNAGVAERQQIKWLAFAAVVFLVLLGAGEATIGRPAISLPILLTSSAVPFVGIPAVIAIAIVRYRLLDIDVLINRTLVYTLLAATITVVYVGVVAGVGTLVGRHGGGLLTIVAAVAIALLFQPLRTRARRFANRLVYGERATPYEVLSQFADRMASAFGLDDVLERMAGILAAGTGATRVDVWLRFDRELRPAASWPADAPTRAPVTLPSDADAPMAVPGATLSTLVRHADELLGALSLEKPRSEPLTATEEQLLNDLASQAGLVLRNVRLTSQLQARLEELRASRRRLVETQDEERRKIERNLHDGAQQQLIALQLQLGLLERLADDPARVREATTAIRAALGDALDDLRDLARGIYPPLLADKGLAAALEAQARKAPVPTTVHADGVGRYPRDVEAAVYFCALEALQNVAKYAAASEVTVSLARRDGAVTFEIRDDGRGFDAATAARGSGLQGMADRIDAVGGTLEIDSAPGAGTVVRGSIAADETAPAREPAPA